MRNERGKIENVPGVWAEDEVMKLLLNYQDHGEMFLTPVTSGGV
jgi:hypothetical protein